MSLEFRIKADVEVDGLDRDEAESLLYQMFERSEESELDEALFFTDVEIEEVVEKENIGDSEKFFIVLKNHRGHHSVRWDDVNTNLNLYKSRELAEKRIQQLYDEDGVDGFCTYSIDVLEVENKV